MPVSARSARPIGATTVLKKGGPTEIFDPVTDSTMIGYRVPQRTVRAMVTSSRLLNRNIASRLNIVSRCRFDLSFS
jgi:hypothetical protein